MGMSCTIITWKLDMAGGARRGVDNFLLVPNDGAHWLKVCGTLEVKRVLQTLLKGDVSFGFNPSVATSAPTAGMPRCVIAGMWISRMLFRFGLDAGGESIRSKYVFINR